MIRGSQIDPTRSAVSFIVVNRNTADLLVRCLDRIYASDLAEVPEVIVVDNGSADDSVARVGAAHPRAVIISAGRNLGFAAANNRAMKKASGEFLILVNTDALLEKDCAGKLLSLATGDPQVGMVAPQLLNADHTLQTSYEAVPTLAGEILNRSLLKRLFPRRYPGKGVRFEKPTEVEAPIGAVMLLRRSAVEAVGGFDERYFFFLEETDLAVRMREAGWKVVHEPSARAVHLQGATAKTVEAAARIEFYRSRYLFFEKHYGRVSEGILKAVLTANLTLNVVILGISVLATAGRVESIKRRLRVRAALWIWHLRGCPSGPGLPRD